MSERKKVIIEVEGERPEIVEFLTLLSKIEILCSVGASRTIPVIVDGDGSASLRFNTPDNPKDWDRLRQMVFKKFKEEFQSGHDLDNHYIGE